MLTLFSTLGLVLNILFAHTPSLVLVADDATIRDTVHLGEALVTGEGLPRDVAKGLQLLEAAAVTDAEAKLVLGRLYLAGTALPRDVAKGTTLLEAAAAAGKIAALDILGTAYLGGSGVPADARKARDYLQRATAAGSTSAKRHLGEALVTGEGLPRDIAEGLQLLETAAATDAEAKLVLGRLYLTGTSVPRDAARALELFEALASTGDGRGLQTIGTSYLWGIDLKADVGKGRIFLVRAGDLGQGGAWALLAQAAALGKLGNKSLSMFEEFAAKARALKDTTIEIYDAQRALYGLGQARNPGKGVSILNSASAKGNPDTIHYLIAIYRDGRRGAIVRNISKAKSYLAKYGKWLPNNELVREEFLIQVAVVQSLDEMARVSREVKFAPVLTLDSIQNEIKRANPRFLVYQLQKALQSDGLYKGRANGVVDRRTMRSIIRACKMRKHSFACGNVLTSLRVIKQLTLYTDNGQRRL